MSTCFWHKKYQKKLKLKSSRPVCKDRHKNFNTNNYNINNNIYNTNNNIYEKQTQRHLYQPSAMIEKLYLLITNNSVIYNRSCIPL